MGKNNKKGAADVVRSYRFPMAITIPAGKCPAELTGTDRDSVKKWILDIMKDKPSGLGYEPTVFKYYSRQFYEISKSEYQVVCSHVDVLLKGKTLFSLKDVNF